MMTALALTKEDFPANPSGIAEQKRQVRLHEKKLGSRQYWAIDRGTELDDMKEKGWSFVLDCSGNVVGKQANEREHHYLMEKPIAFGDVNAVNRALESASQTIFLREFDLDDATDSRDWLVHSHALSMYEFINDLLHSYPKALEDADQMTGEMSQYRRGIAELSKRYGIHSLFHGNKLGNNNDRS